MTTPPHSSLREGEVGGVPASKPSPHNTPEHGAREKPDYLISKRVGIKGVLEVDVGVTKAQVMNACKAMFEHWKEKHPDATHTPIRYSQCSKDTTAPVVQDHRPPAPKGQQH